MAPNEKGFLLEKMLIQEEVKGNNSNDSENFFRKVWKDTIYMASPLGDMASIERITREDMIRFKERILRDQIYCYDSYENVTIINNENSKMKNIYPQGFIYLGSTQIIFKKKSYEIFYFEGRPERLYLLERILKIKNPDKLTQLNEKKKRCALILESKSNFPENENEISNLMPGALSSIMEDVSSIKSNFSERAINELESAFFYGDRWKNRIDTLLSTQSHEILNIIDILSPQSGGYNG
jgi:hypothetical protein